MVHLTPKKAGTRRHWSTAEKLRIVQQTYDPSVTLEQVAAAYDISSGQLARWCKKASQGDFVDALSGVTNYPRWMAAEKLEIVQKTYKPGAVLGQIAKAYGISSSQLSDWRSQASRGTLTDNISASRRWSPAKKLEIVQETYGPGATLDQVAKAYNISTKQLSEWRSQASRGAFVEGVTPVCRRWSPAEKLKIVQEIYKPGATLDQVAETHNISLRQLSEWRRAEDLKRHDHEKTNLPPQPPFLKGVISNILKIFKRK